MALLHRRNKRKNITLQVLQSSTSISRKLLSVMKQAMKVLLGCPGRQLSLQSPDILSDSLDISSDPLRFFLVLQILIPGRLIVVAGHFDEIFNC